MCAEAVGLAREAAEQEGGADAVGAHLRVESAGDFLVTHVFECRLPGYRGWYWKVDIVRAPGDATPPTVNEAVLMPGEGALIAPPWVPWAQRLRSGDLVAGVAVATDPDDPRLAPGWSGEDDLAGPLEEGPLHPVNWEPGFGRARVPSRQGRREAAARWYAGEHGPRSVMAKSAAGHCGTCGWLLLIGGPLGQAFGICTHMLSPADGRVVSFDHGCGAHSEAQPKAKSSAPRVAPVVDSYSDDSLDFGHS